MEIRIPIPEGYEIDEKNSTFECIKFVPLEENSTYEYICKRIFKGKVFYTKWNSDIEWRYCKDDEMANKNNSTNENQLKRLLALNQLLNIAECYNRLHTTNIKSTTIEYDRVNQIYYTSSISTMYLRGISAIFNRVKDAQTVINNPNFQEILNTIYK